MVKQTVTVRFTLDDSKLYFSDLGEMLARHINELCSKGNFGHEFAAGIYRALASQLENAEFDEISRETFEDLARKGFDNAMYGDEEPPTTIQAHIVGPGSVAYGYDDSASSVCQKYRDRKEAKKLQVIIAKYTSGHHGTDDDPIKILLENILPSLEDFSKAQSLLCEMAEAKGLRIVKRFSDWNNLGSGLIDHIQKMTMAAMAIADMKVWAQRS